MHPRVQLFMSQVPEQNVHKDHLQRTHSLLIHWTDQCSKTAPSSRQIEVPVGKMI